MNWNNFQKPNTGLLFYRLIYKEENVLEKLQIENSEIKFNIGKKETSPFEQFYKALYKKTGNKEFVKRKDQLKSYFSNQKNDFYFFELKTVYPGLLIGSGYMHDTKAKGDSSLGFYFDYTTGLPVIPGSSVKGTLRSAFEKAAIYYDNNGNVVDKCFDKEGKEVKCSPSNKKVKKYASQYVKELLKEITGEDWTDDQIYDLEQSIFEGKEDQSLKDRDIFLDAFPVSVSRDGLLGNDYITPHKEPLKNPNPIQFLKVMPGVTFRFDFILQKYEDKNGKELFAKDKLKLFKRILLDLGIGAKTNVGYGQFVEIIENENEDSENNASSRYISLNPSIRSKEDIKDGQILSAKVINLSGGIVFDLGIEDINFTTRLIGISPKKENIKVGDIIKVKVVLNKGRMNFQLEKE